MRIRPATITESLCIHWVRRWLRNRTSKIVVHKRPSGKLQNQSRETALTLGIDTLTSFLRSGLESCVPTALADALIRPTLLNSNSRLFRLCDLILAPDGHYALSEFLSVLEEVNVRAIHGPSATFKILYYRLALINSSISQEMQRTRPEYLECRRPGHQPYWHQLCSPGQLIAYFWVGGFYEKSSNNYLFVRHCHRNHWRASIAGADNSTRAGTRDEVQSGH